MQALEEPIVVCRSRSTDPRWLAVAGALGRADMAVMLEQPDRQHRHEVLESRYEEIMAKPTASDSGTNSERTGSAMMKAGMNTDRMHTMASKRGTAVSLTAAAAPPGPRDGVCSICAWMFSIATVASSTRMPMARARPPSVMMLMVLPVSHSPSSEPSRAIGMLNTTTITLRQIAQEQQDHQPGQRGADQRPPSPRCGWLPPPSATRRTRSGCPRPRAARSLKVGIAWWMSATTVSVEAVFFLTTGMYTDVLAVDHGIAEVEVGAVGDRGHVADVDVSARLTGILPNFLDVGDHGVDGHQRHLVLDVQVAGRDDDVAGGQGLDHVLGREVVGTQAIRIDVDDDGADVGAERSNTQPNQ